MLNNLFRFNIYLKYFYLKESIFQISCDLNFTKDLSHSLIDFNAMLNLKENNNIEKLMLRHNLYKLF